MTERVLTRRELNRALLARQMLLKREKLTAPKAIERVAGLQAQVQNPPYIGLWTRLQGFERDHLTKQMEQRKVVRATLMRSTIHLVTAEDYLLFRPALQPALTRALNAFFGQRAKGLDIPKLVQAAETFFDEEPRTFTDLRALLSKMEPDRDPEALAYAVRTHLPLVQVPPGGTWGTGGNLTYTTITPYLKKPVAESDEPRDLILRYLAAYGPASAMDFQAWSGMTGMKAAVEALKPELRVFRDEKGKHLLDLPDAPLPPEDAPAPPRFVPEYDNLVLSHKDRTRIIADEHRSKVFLSSARVRATFLLDGLVSGTWKIEKAKGAATLVVEPFAFLSKQERDALSEEGEPLLRFVEDKVEAFEVRFEKPM